MIPKEIVLKKGRLVPSPLRFVFSVACVTLVCVAASAAECGSVAGSTLEKHVNHVVLIGIDGLGAQNIPWEKMPNLAKLRERGKYTVARCLYPTASGYNWASCLYGTVADLHGFRDATLTPHVKPMVVTAKGRHPCIFSEIRRQEPSAFTCALYNWEPLGNCYEKTDASCVRCYKDKFTHEQESAYTDEFIKELLPRKPRFTFLYYGSVDETGHFKGGWNSPNYNNACAEVDSLIGKVVAAVDAAFPGDAAFVVVADHGGHGNGHGDLELITYEIPFLVCAPGLDDFTLRDPVIICDVVPTVAWLLGMEIPECWRGRLALRRATQKPCDNIKKGNSK